MGTEIILLVCLAFVASAVGAVASFGTATIMVPIMALFYGFGPVLLFTGVVHAASDMGKIYFFRGGVNWRLILFFGVPGLVVSYVSSLLIPRLPSGILLRLLGVFILAYVVYIFVNPKWKLPKSDKMAALGGSLTGISGALFGVQGAVRALFLSAYNLKKEVFIFTAGAIGLVVDAGRLVGYLQSGVGLEKGLWLAAAVSVPAALAGAYVGKKIVDKIPQDKFRKIIAVALALITIRYLLFA